MRRLINYDFLKDPKNEGRYEVTYLSPDSVFISKLLIQDNGLLYTSGGKLYSYVPPLDHGIVEDEYELLATTNVAGHTFPLHAIWRGFQLKSGAKSANEVYTAAETHLWVKAIALSMEHRPLVPPDQEYYSLDYRFPDVKGIHRIGYVITNDNWQSVTNRDMLSLAAAWGHEDKKGRSVPVIVFLGLLTVPVTLFWALARRRKNQVTRI